ncbi:MAG: DUF1573 domain-containing protein [Opitutus sp.]|nr:DUF1573 domain-containing protein [Opitutus sp.]MCS6274411.1 DUF1573 domain-containing protein [Opitutus sp.]MCS6299777.1 DUF1573 domain-containing protein [Opitutus sp.]
MLALTSAAFGQIKWAEENPEFSIQAEDASFNFKLNVQNTSDRDIQITKVTASCGCTLAAAEPSLVHPGDIATINGIYKPGNRTGMNFVTVTVSGRFDSNSSKLGGSVEKSDFASSVKIKFNIAQSVSIKPGILMWRKDAAPIAKHVSIVTKGQSTIRIADIKLNDELYSYELINETASGSFKIVVSPISTQSFSRETVSFQVVNDSGKARTYYVQLIVR